MSHAPSRESSPLNAALWLATGAAAGVFAGVLIADRFGGGRALLTRLSGILQATQDDAGEDEPEAEYDEYGAEVYGDGDEEDADDAPRIDERVLAAFEQDPVLSQRAIEIDTDEPGTIVLRGAVPSAEDAAHALTIARGTPGVEQVENLLRVRTGRSRAPAEPGPRR